MYLQAPLKALYDYTMKMPHLDGLDEAKDSDINLIISDFKLCELLTPQVKLI